VVELTIGRRRSRRLVTDPVDDHRLRPQAATAPVLDRKQAIDGDPGHWRIYRYDVRRVTSSTGAPTRVNEESGTDYLAVKIGDPNRTVTGRQSYEIVYTVQGVVNPNVQQSAGGQLDEIYWNVIGTGWVVPISAITVTLTGPATLTGAACWTGSGYTVACDGATFADITATYRQARLDPGEGFAIVGGWPAGTFQGGGPILQERRDPPPSSTGRQRRRGGRRGARGSRAGARRTADATSSTWV
jgi:hypothetical protein